MEQQILTTGTKLGGRFEIIALAGHGHLGSVYKATDLELDKAVGLRVIPPGPLAEKIDLNALRDRIKQASALNHRTIQGTFGMGVEDNGSIFISGEWVEGQNLRAILDKRAKAGKKFSFKGAYNLMGHVCNALTQTHRIGFPHLALSPRAILVNNVGRVKVGDWGLSTVRIFLPGYPGRDGLEGLFWAPEVLENPSNASNKSDIFSLGGLFYELITGVAPQRPLKAPSVLGFSKDVDNLIARCMAANPAHRFTEPADVKAALGQLVQAHRAEDAAAETDDDLGIDVEIVLTPSLAPPPAGPPPKPKTPEKKAGGSMLNAPGLPPPPGRAQGPAPGRASEIDMGALLGSLSKSETAHWMVQKDKFDHGPFTDRELVQMILQGEVLGKHMLQDMDTGVRKKLRNWGRFDEVLEQYRIKKKHEEEQAALVATEKAETRGTAFKLALAGGIVAVLVIGGILFFLGRKLREDKAKAPDDVIAALDNGEIKLKSGNTSLSTKKRRKGRGGRGKGGDGGEFVPGMSYEDAMNMAVSLGSLTDNSGQKQLTPADIAAIMDRNVRKFLPCVAGKPVKRVDMNIAIAGNGRVVGVSVSQGDDGLKKCVQSKVRSIKFPESSAPRTAASWYFELY